MRRFEFRIACGTGRIVNDPLQIQKGQVSVHSCGRVVATGASCEARTRRVDTPLSRNVIDPEFDPGVAMF